MNNENLIKAMRETMRRQSQVITSLHQQIESLEGKTAQPTTPTHSWGKITEVDGGFNGEPENEYVNQKIGPLSDDTDALRWATEFANKFTVWSDDGVEPDTKGLMIAWFANAIMAGVDNATRREQSKYVELHQWRRIDRPKQFGWFDDSKQRVYHTDDRIEGRTVYVKKKG